MKTKIKGRYVVGFDEVQNEHVLYRDGEVVFEDDRVVFAGKSYGQPVQKVIDATNCLVGPGFVDVHALMDVGIHPLLMDHRSDSSGRLGRSKDWLFDPQQTPVFSPDEVRAGSEHTFLALLKSGATTFCGMTAMVFKRWDDALWEPEIHAEVALRFGLRAYLSHHFRAGAKYTDAAGAAQTAWDEERGRRGLERNIDFIKKYNGAFDGRINGYLMPYTCDQAGAGLLRETRRAADELKAPIKMHFAQSPAEIEEIATKHDGLTPIEYLESLEFLGPDVMLTHCLFGRGYQDGPGVSDAELAILARRQVSVGHTPWIYAMGGGYLESLSRYLKHGVNVALGTDTHPNDIIREMRWAALMAKTAAGGDNRSGTAREVYNAATVNGARFLGRDDIGRLAPGSKADIVVVDLDNAAVGPQHDPIRSLVYFASLADVRDVFIDGRARVAGGKVTFLDEAEVIRRAQPVADQMRAVLADWTRPGRPAAEVYPPSFEIR
ncbi:MAG: chlorohydrolase family protein [Thermaerobacterales bacterium]